MQDYPENVEQAVRILANLLAPDELASIRALEERQLVNQHFGVARFIRSAFGLWNGNDKLLADTGTPHPDDASIEILRALWRRLRYSSARLH